MKKSIKLLLIVILVFVYINLDAQQKNNPRTKKKKVINLDKNRSFLGIFTSTSVTHNYNAYRENDYMEAVPGVFSENILGFSIMRENSIDLTILYQKFKSEDVFISGGRWNAEHSSFGASLGKVISVKIRIPKLDLLIPLEFSGGPYVSLYLKNSYQHLSGIRDENIELEDRSRVSYGLYTSMKIRLGFMKEKWKLPMIVIGFTYQIPFNTFEYSEDENVVYRLQKKYVFIGLYF